MHPTVSKTICVIELAAAKPPPSLRYTPFLILCAAFGLDYSTMILNNSNSTVRVIFTSIAALLIIKIAVLEKARKDQKVSNKMHILESAVASPLPTCYPSALLAALLPIRSGDA